MTPASPAAEPNSASRLRLLDAFVVQRALPLWAEAGVDGRTGAFLEQLHLDGTPDYSAARRMRVQARQIYVYCHASLLGLFDGRALAERAFARMVEEYWDREQGGFIFSVAADGTPPRDPRRTAYDQAFGLLAMAWLHRLDGSGVYVDWATRTLGFMDAHLADPAHGGYADWPGAPTRCQNPHMHLLEALLALFEATGDAAYLDRADRIVGLFERVFWDPAIAALREFFVAGWAPDSVRGWVLEPGHHLEWVWLLDRYLRHRPGAVDRTEALFGFALRHGIDPRDGLVMAEVSADGTVLRGVKRLWSQTEHLKARVVRHLRATRVAGEGVGEGVAVTVDAIDSVCGLMLAHYLDGSTGGWNDEIGADGVRLSRVMPASTFYHLFLAYAEAMHATGVRREVAIPGAGG